jgi:hypothetical protein
MEYAKKTIEVLEQKLKQLESDVAKIKTTINCLCDVMGEPIRYSDVGGDPKMSPPRRDQYFGRPLATIVTEALEKRRMVGEGAATIDELYDELVAGGFEFVGKNEGIEKRGLAIALGKNPKFTKLANDCWGLTEWYPDAGRARQKRNSIKQGNGQIQDTEEIALEADAVNKEDTTEGDETEQATV